MHLLKKIPGKIAYAAIANTTLKLARKSENFSVAETRMGEIAEKNFKIYMHPITTPTK